MKLHENDGVVIYDQWSPEYASELVKATLNLNDYTEVSENKLVYKLTDSDVFSRVYSKINKSTEFTYIDNESSYDNTSITLVYSFEGGKATLSGDLRTENYQLDIEKV